MKDLRPAPSRKMILHAKRTRYCALYFTARYFSAPSFCALYFPFILGILFSLMPLRTEAQVTAPPQGAVRVLHVPLREDQLGSPGQMIALPLLLQGTKRFDYQLRALVVRDGVFMDLSLPHGTLTDQEVPQFVLKIPSPMRELSYKFILYGEGGSVLAESIEFKLNRTCLPKLDFDGLDASPEPLENAQRLALQARVLERHITAFETAGALLDAIDDVLNLQAQGKTK